MNLIDVKDGGLARNEKFNVTVGVIHLIVTKGEASPEIIKGYCRKEVKDSLIKLLNNQIVWEQTPG